MKLDSFPKIKLSGHFLNSVISILFLFMTSSAFAKGKCISPEEFLNITPHHSYFVDEMDDKLEMSIVIFRMISELNAPIAIPFNNITNLQFYDFSDSKVVLPSDRYLMAYFEDGCFVKSFFFKKKTFNSLLGELA